MLMQLIGSGWGANTKTLCTAALSLVYSIGEYCTPVWCHSTHTYLIDSVLNDALHIVTGCLHLTPTDNLTILSGIQPAEFCQLGATLFLAYCESLDPNHILCGLYKWVLRYLPGEIRSRLPFVPAAQNLLNNFAGLGIHASEWTYHRWNAEYCENTSRLCVFILKTSARPVGMSLP